MLPGAATAGSASASAASAQSAARIHPVFVPFVCLTVGLHSPCADCIVPKKRTPGAVGSPPSDTEGTNRRAPLPADLLYSRFSAVSIHRGEFSRARPMAGESPRREKIMVVERCRKHAGNLPSAYWQWLREGRLVTAYARDPGRAAAPPAILAPAYPGPFA